MRLYELTESWGIIQALVEDDETQDEQLQAAIQNIAGAIEDKADNYAKLIKSLEAEILGIKEEETRLRAMRQSRENRMKWLKRSLEESMIATGKTKFKTPLFGFNIQRNPPSVRVQDETKIPEQYWKVERTLSRKDMLTALKEGIEIPGADMVTTESLRIR